MLFATAVAINGAAFAGDFSGTVAYAAVGERCVEHGDLQVCLEGAKPVLLAATEGGTTGRTAGDSTR